MTRKQVFTSAAALLFALLTACYMGYQVAVNLSEKIITADAVSVTAEDVISADGVFIRSEQLIYAEAGGSVEFLVEEGAKVANGQQIAGFFNDQGQLALYRQSRALEQQIESVKYAFSHMADGTDSVKLDSLIKMNLLAMGDKLDRGALSQAEEYAARLDAMIVQRGAAQKGETDYASILADLESQKAGIDAQIQGGAAALAPTGGYFIGSVDGLEQTLTPAGLETLSARQIRQALEQPAPQPGGAIGKVTDEYQWYFAALVNEEQAGRLRKLNQATLRFHQLLSEDVVCQIESVRQDEDGQWIALFRGDYMNAALLQARDQQADIVLQAYSGLKVPKEALRQNDEGQWGAYCLEGARVVFKPTSWVFQTETYYVAEPDAEKGGLTLYDKMVVKAKNIENIKVVR